MPVYKREGKTYEMRKSAIRAAKEDGLIDGQFDIVEDKNSFKYVVKKVHKTVAEQIGPQLIRKKVAERVLKRKPFPTGKPPKKDLDPELLAELAEDARTNPLPEPDPIPAKKLKLLDYSDGSLSKFKKEEEEAKKAEEVSSAKLQQEISAIARVAPPKAPRVLKVVENGKPIKADNKLHKSSVSRPTGMVWEIAEEMFTLNVNTTRKEVIEECTKRGIAYYTARTQYQQWLSTVRGKNKNKSENSL